jgi:hypothetical protein
MLKLFKGSDKRAVLTLGPDRLLFLEGLLTCIILGNVREAFVTEDRLPNPQSLRVKEFIKDILGDKKPHYVAQSYLDQQLRVGYGLLLHIKEGDSQ